VDGRLVLRVTKVAGDSAIARILRLVEEASEKKAKTERFITRFAVVYTPIVTGSAVLLAVIAPLFFGGAWAEWVRRAVILLVVSCPCALVISVPLGFFGGIGAASRQGILIKGSNYLEQLARAETVVFDKTGTLTKGVFTVQAVHGAPGLLAVAAHAEGASTHPIAASLQAAHRAETGIAGVGTVPSNVPADCCDRIVLGDVHEVSGKGISVTVDGTPVLAGTLDLLNDGGVEIGSLSKCNHCECTPAECARRDGGTVIHVSENGKYAGHIVIADEVKGDAAAAISGLKAAGIKRTVMLTGDSAASGEKAARDLGVDEVYTELLPADKVDQVEFLLAEKGRKGSLIFVGDGINDAPVLARSDVGIAMGALGSDAAVEAADAVIMSDEPSRLIIGIEIARRTMGVVRQNIVFSLGVKAAVLGLGAVGMGTVWLAVFADVGVTFLAVLNSLRLLAPENNAKTA
jgi:Cd2+/Zn2+-exporting ATPase